MTNENILIFIGFSGYGGAALSQCQSINPTVRQKSFIPYNVLG